MLSENQDTELFIQHNLDLYNTCTHTHTHEGKCMEVAKMFK